MLLHNQSGPRKGYLKGDDLASNISHTNYVNLSEEKQLLLKKKNQTSFF